MIEPTTGALECPATSFADHSLRMIPRLGCVVERRVRSGSLAVDCADAETFDRAQVWLLAQEDIGFDVLLPPRRADDRETD